MVLLFERFSQTHDGLRLIILSPVRPGITLYG
jgi:hypothetical protein